MSRILIADDQPDVLEALRILLKGEGYQTDGVTSLGAVMNSLEKRTYALLMMDLNYTRDTKAASSICSSATRRRPTGAMMRGAD